MTEGAFVREREELGMYFAGLGPAIGLRAAPLEPGARGIYDAMASHVQHMQKREWGHRMDMRAIARVTAALGAMPAGQRMLQSVFTPFGAGRASFRLLQAIAHEGQSLVGLAVQTEALRRLFRSRMKDADPTPDRMLVLLNDEAGALRRGNRIPSGHRLYPVLNECTSGYTWAMEVYAAARDTVVKQMAEERREDRARRWAEMQRKLEMLLS